MHDYKVKNPLLDPALYLALVPLTLALAPHEIRVFVQNNPEAIAPILAYVVGNKWLRGKAIDATLTSEFGGAEDEQEQ